MFDTNSEGFNDVNFSTTGVNSFNTLGLGVDQLFVSELGLEGFTGIIPDLHIDILNGQFIN